MFSPPKTDDELIRACRIRLYNTTPQRQMTRLFAQLVTSTFVLPVIFSLVRRCGRTPTTVFIVGWFMLPGAWWLMLYYFCPIYFKAMPHGHRYKAEIRRCLSRAAAATQRAQDTSEHTHKKKRRTQISGLGA